MIRALLLACALCLVLIIVMGAISIGLFYWLGWWGILPALLIGAGVGLLLGGLTTRD